MQRQNLNCGSATECSGQPTHVSKKRKRTSCKTSSNCNYEQQSRNSCIPIGLQIFILQFPINPPNLLPSAQHFKFCQIMHLPRTVTVELHQIVHLPVNSAPARKRSHDSASSHMKRNLHCAEQQEPPSDITKYSTLPAPKNDMPRKVALDLLLFCDCDFTILLLFSTILLYSTILLFHFSLTLLFLYSSIL